MPQTDRASHPVEKSGRLGKRQLADGHMQYVLMEKTQGFPCMFQSAERILLTVGQMLQELPDFSHPHLARVPLAMEHHISQDPADIVLARLGPTKTC